MEGAHVADLFCGTGSLGMEALSRGADSVVFFESDRRVVELLRKNIERAGFARQATVRQANAFRFGFASVPGAAKFGVVFVDPPYRQSEDVKLESRLGVLLQGLADQITGDGVVVVRTQHRVVLLDEYGDLKVVDRREWGTQAVAFLQRTVAEIQHRSDTNVQ